MLDTSYGFNNLLKEVKLYSLWFRDTNTSVDLKKSSWKILMHANKSVLKSKDPLDHMVSSIIELWKALLILIDFPL